MEHFIDFKKRLRVVTWQLAALGLWPPSGANKLYRLYTALLIAIANLHNVCQILYWILVPSDFNTLIISAITIFEEISVNVKLYGILKYQENGTKLMENCNEKQPKNETQREKATSTMWQFKFFHVLYTVSSGLCCTFVTLSGVLDDPVRLPSPGWYPFNQTRYFVPIYVHQGFGLYYATFSHVSIDCFSIGLMALIIVQCDILVDSLKKLNGTGHEKLELELLANIKHHQEILLHFKGISDMLTWIIFGQYASSTVTLCVTLLQASLVAPSDPLFAAMLVYASVMVGQLFLYCWWGNEVIVKSEQIPAAAFECRWIKASPKFRRDLLFVIHRTQTPLELFGAGYFKVSLQNFMMILRHSYSFYAVLGQMNRDS